jgi:putative autoinducer-2 (AI-2) aldolase
MRTPVVMRASGGPSILKELSDEQIAIDIEDAARLNVAALAVQVFIGGEHETQSVHNMTRLVDLGLRYGIPVMGVTAVGKQLTRDAKYLRLACRICAELGAQFVKTYYCDEDFETVTSSCPVPIVGRRQKAARARGFDHGAPRGQRGKRRVDMGRNIFQSDSPVGMMRAVTAVVHDGATPEAALEIYRSLKPDGGAPHERLMPSRTRLSVGILTADWTQMGAGAAPPRGERR